MVVANERLIQFVVVWFCVCIFWQFLHIPSWLIKWIWWGPIGVLTFCPVPIWMLSVDLMAYQKSDLERQFKQSELGKGPTLDYRTYKKIMGRLDNLQFFWFLVFFALMLFVAIQGGKLLHIPELFIGYTNWEL